MPRSPMIVRAPLTPEQVEHLEAYQGDGRFHPYTCPNRSDGNHPIEARLRAAEAGWSCDFCAFTQTWAHGAHADFDAGKWPVGSEPAAG